MEDIKCKISKRAAGRMGLKVTLDTNIFLNIKNKEEPFYKYSRMVYQKYRIIGGFHHP